MPRKLKYDYDIKIITKLSNKPFNWTMAKIARHNKWPRKDTMLWVRRHYLIVEDKKVEFIPIEKKGRK